MIFHKKIFQCVTAPIPLFQTPQKIGLLIHSYPFSKLEKKCCVHQARLRLHVFWIMDNVTTTQRKLVFNRTSPRTIESSYHHHQENKMAMSLLHWRHHEYH